VTLKKPSELFEQRRLESLAEESLAEESTKKETSEVKNKKLISPKELFGEVVAKEDIIEETLIEETFVEEVVELKEDNTKEDLTGFVEERIGKQTETIQEKLKEKFDEYSEEFEDKTKKYYQDLSNQFDNVKENLIKKVSSLEVDILRNEHHLRNNNVDVDEIRKDINETIQKIKSEIIEDVGVLQEPPSNVTSDPLTPLDQNFVTLEQLQEHYRIFINRIQQQLSTFGGGGETRLEFLDDIDRNSAKVNGRFLKYDATSGKWVGAVGGGGGSQTLDDTLGLGNTSSLGMSVGVVTATYFVGDGSLLTNVPESSNSGYANTAGIATYATRAGIATYATSSGIATYAISSGISTYAGSSGIATYATISGYSTSSGIATYAFSSGISTYSGTSGISTVAQGLTGTPNITVGIVTATKYYGDGSSLTGISAGGITSTTSINTTGIITANSYYVGSTQVINSAGQWVGSGLSVYSNIDGGIPNSIYGGIPVIDGGVP
jgi:hypothetical protein